MGGVFSQAEISVDYEGMSLSSDSLLVEDSLFLKDAEALKSEDFISLDDIHVHRISSSEEKCANKEYVAIVDLPFMLNIANEGPKFLSSSTDQLATMKDRVKLLIRLIGEQKTDLGSDFMGQLASLDSETVTLHDSFISIGDTVATLVE
eukprot:GHVH01013919.1.p1 GENE.GHVH01013919.1~~GHVH01013919.1.p1  ORF type:complete len:149 (-),score=17.72 GHVH01013919.1:74-520(-)